MLVLGLYLFFFFLKTVLFFFLDAATLKTFIEFVTMLLPFFFWYNVYILRGNILF